MRKFSFSMFFVLLALIILFIGNLRKINATVVEIKQDIVIFEDTTGNLWAYKDTREKFSLGQDVVLTLNDKGTDFIEDDEIFGVK